MSSEFDLIARIRSRVGTRRDVLLGIGDDAAIVRVPQDRDLVIAMDTLNAGVHFPQDTAPCDIGWKALAVNLSDLAAMGAEPAFCTLSLSLPSTDIAGALLDGFLALAARHDVALIGGDTTRGPLSLTVTVHGYVPCGTALRRDGARVGDDVWVTGTLGDAAAALAQWQRTAAPSGEAPHIARASEAPHLAHASEASHLAHASEASHLAHASEASHLAHASEAAHLAHAHAHPARCATLRVRLDRPTPRVDIGLALRGLATACIDISDGLAADLGHILAASRVGADLDAHALPTSAALRAAFDDATLRRLQLTGGDDYELCFTAPPAHRAECARHATRIGTIEPTPGLRLRGTPIPLDHAGWDHFR